MNGVRQGWLVAMREMRERSRSRAFRASIVLMIVAVAAVLMVTALARRFRTEHRAIRADIEQLRTIADVLGSPAAMTRVRQVHGMLTAEVWPHESAEEAELYPALNQLLGGTDPTAPMSRAHAEIAYQIARLGRLIDDIGTWPPDEQDIADLRGILYGLHAILRLHTVQEDETYLSLGDSADADQLMAG